MGQASTCAKLHGTNSENHDDSAAVHRMSEESDSGRPNHRTSQGVWCSLVIQLILVPKLASTGVRLEWSYRVCCLSVGNSRP
jgi:hypothetical protein